MHWFTIYLTNGRMPQMIKMSSSSKLIFPCPSPKASVHQSSVMHRVSFARFTVICTKSQILVCKPFLKRVFIHTRFYFDLVKDQLPIVTV